jgi:hypothetical protein
MTIFTGIFQNCALPGLFMFIGYGRASPISGHSQVRDTLTMDAIFLKWTLQVGEIVQHEHIFDSWFRCHFFPFASAASSVNRNLAIGTGQLGHQVTKPLDFSSIGKCGVLAVCTSWAGCATLGLKSRSIQNCVEIRILPMKTGRFAIRKATPRNAGKNG